MNMFSKELLELDRNTAAYMVDVMQKEIDEQKQALDEQKHKLDAAHEQIAKTAEQLTESEKREQAAYERIAELEALLEATK